MILEVGKPFEGTPKRYTEGTHYNYGVGGHALTGMFIAPESDEVADWKRGKPSFALTVVDGLFFFLSRFGSQPWNDSPYRWHSVPQDARDLPSADFDNNKSMFIHCTLCDARNGEVRAIRAFGPDTAFMAALHAEIRKQSETEIPIAQYNRDLSRIMNVLTTEQLLARASARSV